MGGVAQPSDATARQRREALEKRLQARSVDELKMYLRHNNQVATGTKPELARRVADAAVFGALPACPSCGGHLHSHAGLDSPRAKYLCKRVTRKGRPCGYEACGVDLSRVPFTGVEAEPLL